MEEKKCSCENCQCSGKKKEETSSRRTFLSVMVGVINVAVASAVVAPMVGFVASPLRAKRQIKWVPLLKEGELPDGATKEVKFAVKMQDGYQQIERKYSLFLRRKGSEVMAIDPSCTHLGCRVAYREDKDEYLCPCHGGVFDNEGRNVSGPPPKPLERHPVKLENGRIWVGKEV